MNTARILPGYQHRTDPHSVQFVLEIEPEKIRFDGIQPYQTFYLVFLKIKPYR